MKSLALSLRLVEGRNSCNTCDPLVSFLCHCVMFVLFPFLSFSFLFLCSQAPRQNWHCLFFVGFLCVCLFNFCRVTQNFELTISVPTHDETLLPRGTNQWKNYARRYSLILRKTRRGLNWSQRFRDLKKPRLWIERINIRIHVWSSPEQSPRRCTPVYRGQSTSACLCLKFNEKV